MRFSMLYTTVAVVATFANVAGCGGGKAAVDKSGSDIPVTLRLGTVEDENSVYADEVERFADSVKTLSDGSINVEIVWMAPGPFTGESETTLATMTQAGEIDLGVVPTRAWDQLDVTSMQALQAPFMVDSFALLNEIASSHLAEEMLAGLDNVGVTGLAMWPESLRHPVGFNGPLLTAADFHGAGLRVPVSDASYRLARAIGAEPVNPEDWDAAFESGELDGAESAFVWAFGLPLLGTFTGNITFYPKVNTVVVNTDRFDELTDEQQDALRQAAVNTLDYVVESNATEHDSALAYCATGGGVALAEESDIAELAALAEPVFAELSEDANTARVLDEMLALKDTVTTDPATLATACEPEGDDVSATTVSVAEFASFPEGVFRAEAHYPESPNPVLTTLTFEDGRWIQHDDGGDCGGPYVVESGRIRMFLEAPHLCGGSPDVPIDAAWTFSDGELRFFDFASNTVQTVTSVFGGQPWTKIE